MDNACDEQLLNFILNLIFLGEGMKIGKNIGRKVFDDEGNGIIMNTMGRMKSLGSRKNNLIFGEDGLEVRKNKGCLGGMNGMEL
jgi:hypothetical protein